MENLLSFIFILGLVFYWLMLESKWLTIRLERTPSHREIDIGGLLTLGIGMIFVAIGKVLKPLGFWHSQNYTEEDCEKDMARLWQVYGRKQPQRVLG